MEVGGAPVRRVYLVVRSILHEKIASSVLLPTRAPLSRLLRPMCVMCSLCAASLRARRDNRAGRDLHGLRSCRDVIRLW